MDKITVVVPVYNAEKYLCKCIDSIINQTYSNIEVLLINDGSTDRSLSLLKNYEKKYPDKITVYSQENQGVSSARNYAIKNAHGDFITFVDSDDWIENDYLATLRKELMNNDIIISGFKRYDKEYNFQYEKITEKNDWTKYKYCSIAGKMYRLSFLRDNNILYEKSFKIGEDGLFNIYAYSKTEKVVVAEYAGYCNYENVKSVTNNRHYTKEDSFINVLKEIDKKVTFEYINKKHLSFYYIKAIVLDVILAKNYLSLKDLRKMYKENYQWYKRTLKNKYDCRPKLYMQKGETLTINLAVNVFLLFTKLHIDKLILYVLQKVKVSII